MKKKNSIKRAQSQASLSFAERKNFRPMAKILTLLVLLMTAVTGAWAQEQSETFTTTAKIVEGTHFTISNNDNWADADGMEADYGITVTAKNGETITKVVISCNYIPESVNDGNTSVSSGTKEITNGGGTITVTGVNASTFTFTCSDSSPEFSQFVVYYTEPTTDYYLVGNMNSWGINPQYKLALNESAGDANEYQIALALPAATELKVVSSTDGTAIKAWFPAEAGNKYVQNDGLYTIYFRPGYNGGSDWHAGCIYVADGVNLTADGEAWTLAQMPACNVELEVEYYPLATLATLPAAAEGVVEGTDAALLTPGTSAEGTLAYAIGTSEAPTGQWSQTIPTAQDLTAGTCYVWYKVVGDAQHSDSQPQSIAVTVAAAPTFAVTIDDAGVDASNWQATPAEPKTGQTVTLSYSGKKKIRSITIEAAPAAPAGPTLDLATVTEATTVEDGYTLTGTLGANVKISIADGATVTLDGVTINGENNFDYAWAGINCLGDATIILSGTNTVKGFQNDYPGIYVPENKTLTIQGSGSLTASSNGCACGIGGGYGNACGNIVIAGGTITATGGMNAAGIGGGNSASCGNISITGGTIIASGGDGAGIGGGFDGSCGNISITGGTITANGGNQSAGIGGGSWGSCGTITITNGVTSVTATKGNSNPYSIGPGYDGSCGKVTIGGTEGAITTSPYTYEP